MSRFVFLSIFFLGWAFYEVSGGADFTQELEAEKLAAQQLEEDKKRAAAKAAEVEKTRLAAAKAAVVTEAMVTRAAFNPTSVVAQPAPKPTRAEPAEKPKVEATAEDPVTDIRKVRSTRVNVRNGPSTRYNVILKLTRGTRVEILQDPGNGWVKLKVEDTGRIGWMAARLLEKTTG
jgi:sRNA-binding protein